MNYVELLKQVVVKNNLNTSSLEALLNDLASFTKAHNEMVTSVSTAVTNALRETKSAFISCPNCGSNTLLGFGDCHVCGHQLFEAVEATSNVELKNEKKTEKVVEEKPKAKASSKKTVELDDDELEELEEKPKKKGTPKASDIKTKAKAKELDLDLDDFDDGAEFENDINKAKTNKKTKETKQNDIDLDDSLDLEDDEPVVPSKTKAKAKVVDDDFEEEEEVTNVDDEFDDIDDFDLDL